MASKLVSHYLHPDYLDPLPSSTVDSKLSPLALLAQTCSNIGKDVIANQQTSDHKLSGKYDRQSPISTAALAKSNSSSPLASPMSDRNVRTSPHGNGLHGSSHGSSPYSDYSQRKSPCSTKAIERSILSRSCLDGTSRFSPLTELHKNSVCSKEEVCMDVADTAARLSPSLNSSSSHATSKAAHNQLFLPDLAPNAMTLNSDSSTSSTVAAAAFSLPSELIAAYKSYSAAATAAALRLSWPTSFIPPSAHFTGCFDTPCNQQPSCTGSHRSGSTTVCSCTHCSQQTKSVTDYYKKLLQNTTASQSAPSASSVASQGKVTAEFCMYCGKHCPSLEELVNHVRSHDLINSTTESALQAPFTFGFYPPNSSLGPDFLRKAWSYAAAASRFQPYRGTASRRLNSTFPASFSTSLV